ncbi:energy transducer TonB [Spongiimicrobium sp. 3-5]|uniref:energy transducer TonB n=1 Tax=Spongiimicrobium sp. 3-5 TaxID=3332596 RepID=UPI00397FAD47
MKPQNTEEQIFQYKYETENTEEKRVRKTGKQHINLRKNSFFHFQIGLIIAMLLVYFGLEASFKTFGEQNSEPTIIEDYAPVFALDANTIIVEKPLSELKKPKKNTSSSFKEVSNDHEIEAGTEFISKPEEGTGEISLDSIAYEKEIEEIPEVPITVVQELPIFPGCEKVANSDRLACFQKKIQKHIKRNFRYPKAEKELGIHGRVNVLFKIDADGTISEVRMSGPSKGLEIEAERIIKKLPQMVPAKHNGRSVKVPYAIPIVFQLN